MAIAYLVNQYPKVSHSFIRREIAAVEACGIPIARYAIRACRDELVDEADLAELDRTYVVMDQGLKRLAIALAEVAIAQPTRFLKALNMALKLARHSDRGIVHHLIYLAEACHLLRQFRAARITHVHAHFGTNSTTVALLCQQLGGPTYSFTAHGPEEFDKPTVISLSEKIQHASFVAAISSFGKSQLFRWCEHRHWSKVHIVHCGVDQEFLDHIPSPVSEVPQLVCVGRLSEQKGYLLLLEAARQLTQQGMSFKLVLVGDGPLRSEIEALIHQWNLQHCVEITGWASGQQVQQQLLAARAMVLPSFAEGLPVVIMEALALGRPVISTYIAGIPELIVPGQCGWLVPPGDADELAIAMKAALTASTAELTQMGAVGRARTLQQHNSFIEAGKLASLFSQSLSAEPSAAGHESAIAAPTLAIAMSSTATES
ncbi:glycosyltransferase [Leptolyngbya sp. AN02str]|uniref:glycosyltransferase n=1 Tax=Leptolyngbya sp. AN02str TaxID=3423363 RepID=UPI003D315688